MKRKVICLLVLMKISCIGVSALSTNIEKIHLNDNVSTNNFLYSQNSVDNDLVVPHPPKR